MTYFRLIRASQVLANWPGILTGLRALREKAGFDLPTEAFQKLLCSMAAKTDTCFIIVARDDALNCVGFAVAYESTKPFEEERSFTTLCVYHKTGERTVTKHMDELFTAWCREHGVRRVYTITSRHSGAATRCFATFGYKPAGIIFEKEIS